MMIGSAEKDIEKVQVSCLILKIEFLFPLEKIYALNFKQAGRPEDLPEIINDLEDIGDDISVEQKEEHLNKIRKRIEKLEVDKVFRSLRAYFETMELQQRIKVSSSWDALRKTLESLPSRKNNLLKMKIDEFPEQSSTQDHPSVPQHLEQYFNEDELPEIRGEMYCNTTATNTEFSNNVPVNTDVVVYTRSKHNRPWVGRVVKHLSGGKFTIHWYKRRGRGNHFEAMNNFDGSPVLSDQENEVVMYWHIADQDSITDTSFQIPLLWLEKLKQEYVDHDLAYE